MQHLLIRPTKLDAEMRGVELATHVPGVLPGELARVRIDHVDRLERKFGTLLEVLEPTPARVVSPCARFLDCSGCDLLQASESFQLEAKRARVASALGVDVDPVVPSPRQLGYRALAKLVVGPGGLLGSYRSRSHDVADMQGCVVHAPEAERVVEAIRVLQPSSAIRYVLVRASIAEGRAIVVLVTRDEDRREVSRIAAGLSARAEVAAVYQHVNDSSGDELLGSGGYRAVFERGVVHEKIGELVYALEPGAFAQVNPLAAAELYARAVELAAPRGLRVLDLYSGSAGLALGLARAGAAEVVAVESSAAAVRAAERSREANGVSSTSLVFVHARAEEAPLSPFDVVVLNPPRKGASRLVLDRVCEIAPSRIVYVSCNPDTLARDLGLLSAEYRVARVVPVDLFPGTRHVETIALIERR